MATVILFLSLLLLILLIGIGRRKGLRAFLSFGVSILLFVYAIIPLIIAGYPPVVVILLLAIPVLAFIVYFTEGFNPLSHLMILVTLLNFALTSLLTSVSVSVARLTGLGSDIASSVGATGINLHTLLIAGIMLGSLGVLTEMTITQVATVFELSRSQASLDPEELRDRAYAVGMSHLGSIITTLFLVYVGISLPLLVIFIGESGSFLRAMNYEPLAKEIIRTLIATIGLVIAMPISTQLAIWWVTKRTKVS